MRRAQAFLPSPLPALRGSQSATGIAAAMQSENMPRRRAMLQAGAAFAAPLLVKPQVSRAETAAVSSTTYKDEAQGVEFMVPKDWQQQAAVFPGGENDPASPKIVAFVSENKDINMALVSYSIRSDNAKLGSFGTIADVRKNIVRR